MFTVLFQIVLALCLLFLLGIIFGKFCQLSNDDRDDFRQEWKELNTFSTSKTGFHRLQRFLAPSRKITQQSKKVVGLAHTKRTEKAP